MNFFSKKVILTFCFFNVFTLCVFASTVSSPNSKVKFSFSLNIAGEPSYTVSYNNNAVLENSPLGLNRNDDVFSKNLRLISENDKYIRQQYQLLTGKKTKQKTSFNQKEYVLRSAQNNEMRIQIRVYNEGVAFRYIFGDEKVVNTQITNELTGFDIPDKAKMWIMPYDTISLYTPAYETYYTNAATLQTKCPNKEGWSFPALFHINQNWMLITEAGLSENYCASHLDAATKNGLFRLRFPENTEALGNFSPTPNISFPFSSPWRVIMLGDNCGTILQSSLVTHVSEPSQIKNTAWIKPGKSSWSWWSDHDSPRNYESLKKFVDFSAEMGWEYSLVDANWDLMTGGNVNQLIDYAATKKVGIWLWYNSGGSNNAVTERPRDIMFDSVKRKQEFEKISKWGVKGVKIDFFQSDKQEIIKLYLDILRDAAANKIMVNFHGCTLPRGWQRTYPNLLTMEAVRGAENYGFDANYPDKAPWHNTIYPFTRNVVGSMDYTPVTFSNQRFPHLTTNTHELALSVVYESGIQHFADKTEAYKQLNSDCKNLISKLPVSWDETKYIAGEPGKYVVIARRKGKKWYVGGINGQTTVQEIKISLKDLPLKFIIADNAQLTPTAINTTTGFLNVKMVKFGGFVAY